MSNTQHQAYIEMQNKQLKKRVLDLGIELDDAIEDSLQQAKIVGMLGEQVDSREGILQSITFWNNKYRDRNNVVWAEFDLIMERYNR